MEKKIMRTLIFVSAIAVVLVACTTSTPTQDAGAPAVSASTVTPDTSASVIPTTFGSVPTLVPSGTPENMSKYINKQM
jgi:ABC-type glycerol-3-phosphate transport system substrate-binding protein